jgi:1A family penicillin-binding protein
VHPPSPTRRLKAGRALCSALALALGLTAAAQEPFAAFPPQPAGIVPITILDGRGQYLGRILPQKRYWVAIDRIPAFLQQALLAVEDARFYEHGGIDVRGIARALVADVAKGRLAEGGSTITQQLIKNKFLSSERSLDRKVQEARMAVDFEKQYTKRQILEMYFNEIYYGNGAVGIAQAARLYFNKAAEELSDAECLMLAGVPKNPARYNPFGPKDEVARRRDVVLKRLLDLDLITEARRRDLRAHPGVPQGPGHAPSYLAYLRTQLTERYGPDITEKGGLVVTATLDLNLQKQAEKALREGIRRLTPGLQGAMVCLDPATGDVLAAVGDVDNAQNALNRAFLSRRQPGSAIKPLIYAEAVEAGLTASSIWSDAPVSYDRGDGTLWTPHNFGGEQFGSLSLRQALAHSDNVISVKVLEAIQVPAFVAFAGRLGLALQARNGLSLALGTDEVTLKDLVQAYTPLAAGGTLARARTMVRIYDRRSGAFTEFPPDLTPVLSPEAACVTTRMLQDVLVYGTAKGLRNFSAERPAAGKTGTTDAYQDAWFIGYTPDLLAGVWVGFDKPRPGGRGFTGGAVAAPIWERFMNAALAGRPVRPFPTPETVVTVNIDPATGHLAPEESPGSREEVFIQGTEPTADLPGPEAGAAPLGLPKK